ncbi:MAG TPA: hypothetical protein VN203_00250 [Candidatus Acidoferrum sp.]|nr:hypothetical protein [Candidatus Acidoferrum sp.]
MKGVVIQKPHQGEYGELSQPEIAERHLGWYKTLQLALLKALAKTASLPIDRVPTITAPLNYFLPQGKTSQDGQEKSQHFR